jgi:flagellar basal body-associated protein FliL
MNDSKKLKITTLVIVVFIVVAGLVIAELVLFKPTQNEPDTAPDASNGQTQVEYESVPGNQSIEMVEGENGQMVPYSTANNSDGKK